LYKRTGGAYINTYNFEDAAYNVIYNGNPTNRVILASGATPLPYDFGTLSLNSTNDYDDDGLLDVKEINYTHWLMTKNGKVDLPSYQECEEYIGGLYGISNYSVLEGIESLTEAQKEELYSSDVVLINSDPTNKDGDLDSFDDKYETQNDGFNPLKRDAAVIQDDVIDDSHCFENNTEVHKVTNPFCNAHDFTAFIDKGEYDDDSASVVKKILRFTRNAHSDPKQSDDTFTITPEENSDYKFTLTCSEYDSRYDNIALTVTNKGKTVEPVPESETNSSDKFTYHYALEKGEKYFISVKYLSNEVKAYNLTAEQDNWVYAPKGGRWTPLAYSNSNVGANVLRAGSIYISTEKFITTIKDLNNGIVILQLNPNKDFEEQINAVLNNTGMAVSEEDMHGALIALGGTTATTVGVLLAILIPEPASTVAGVIKAAKLIATIGADVYTYAGTPAAISTLDGYFEQYGFAKAYAEGYSNVCCTTYNSMPTNTWEAWTSASYINRYSIGERGEIDVTISSEDIINWCGWKKISVTN
jgi:hypothetical protein